VSGAEDGKKQARSARSWISAARGATGRVRHQIVRIDDPPIYRAMANLAGAVECLASALELIVDHVENGPDLVGKRGER
jgi:hypothetical protein